MCQYLIGRWFNPYPSGTGGNQENIRIFYHLFLSPSFPLVPEFQIQILSVDNNFLRIVAKTGFFDDLWLMFLLDI